MILGFSFLLSACSPKSTPVSQSAKPASAASTNVQIFQVKGVITKLFPGGKSVEIRHEVVPNYMPAMTMPFDVKDPKELTGLKTNDPVTFRLSVTDTDAWIYQIKKIEGNSLTDLPATNGFRFVRDVEPLQIGDPLPDYHFTNQFGEPVSTTQFKGQALAITFIFTRCPLPNFCPRMSSNFEEVQTKLLSPQTSNSQPSTLDSQPPPSGPSTVSHQLSTNWHLLTLSFDPEFDTPVILKSYADRFHADPAHWSFFTGDPADVRAFADQFGQTFWKDETGSINHNLRTIIVTPTGRIHQILQGNKWTADELASSLREAAKAN